MRELGLLVGVSLLAVLAALVISRTLTVPMRRLARHAVDVGKGDFGQRIEVDRPAELTQLAEAFNYMAGEIRAREDQRDVYLHAISHDLRGPLTVVHGQAQMIQHALRKPDNAERIGQSAEAILTSTRRINTMIQDLVDSARLDSGHFVLRSESLDVERFVCHLLERMADMMAVERVRVRESNNLPMCWPTPTAWSASS